MAKPEKPLAYNLPLFLVSSVTPVLEKEGKIYARLITAQDRDEKVFTIRERTGIEVEKYTEKPLECVVEIIKARFFDLKDDKIKPPTEAIHGTFVGWETGYKFFQELVSMVDGETGDADDEDFNEDEYDMLATELFTKWGIYGFGLDVYRDKPMLKTEQGVYFLNEFIFEELIDKWEESFIPNIPVCFIIDELLLHGIKIFEGEWKQDKSKQQEITAGHNEMIIRGGWQILDPY